MSARDLADFDEFLAHEQQKTLLRFITCGSVDDGKSTLIGRLLFDAQQLFDDQLESVRKDSRRWGTQDQELDLALLVDGLAAEREQGITIDVAYRYFSSAARKFIVADTPGHEQYTRNMATAASGADAAVILIDARQGVLPQTRRHACIAQMLGIRHIVLAINKMDLVDYRQAVFDAIAADFDGPAQRLGIAAYAAIPVCALHGDNIYLPSRRMPWYAGPTLMGWLETREVDETRLQRAPMRFPVQWVNRPDADFRGYAGTLVAGMLQPGDAVRVLPGGQTTRVQRIITMDGELAQARAGQAVTVTLQDEVDVSRGDLLAPADDPPQCADQFQVRVIWLHETPLYPGRRYRFKAGGCTGLATVTGIRHQLDMHTLEHLAASTLGMNAIGVCTLSLDRDIAFDAYAENRETGSLILIDRHEHHTVAAVMIEFALRRASNIHRQRTTIDQAARSELKGHPPAVFWFTGLSGSGKSTIANAFEQQLHALGVHTYLLDGDNLRHGLNRDLGFTESDRVENIRRVAEVARLMSDAGLVVLTAFISPFKAERELARELIGAGRFVEVFVDTPLAVAERRDPKGLYAKARRGDLHNFTGIDSPYEAPAAPECRLDAGSTSVDACVDALLAHWRQRPT
jgi:bifunctional enzyme CysN/CysC